MCLQRANVDMTGWPYLYLNLNISATIELRVMLSTVVSDGEYIVTMYMYVTTRILFSVSHHTSSYMWPCALKIEVSSDLTSSYFRSRNWGLSVPHISIKWHYLSNTSFVLWAAIEYLITFGSGYLFGESLVYNIATNNLNKARFGLLDYINRYN